VSKQPLIIALMQANARLVKDIEHADQAGANLRSQPNPLGLAAAQGPGRPVQGDIVQANIIQKAQPGINLFQNLPGNRPAAARSAALRQNNRGNPQY